ncbi:membrane-bound O-acyltransferase [Ordospora pajunii]|uniref:membrane-bound O-acyltransferase n=1 Tax=Ordospora pajunii TaxID=3039483 RepID=UPI002952617B|nr:membrane-bound O-acyltransferase [Ordospora pajunii]KAH9411515.1 membrane-bound O-acyltransferase [Ordospora pajunii]
MDDTARSIRKNNARKTPLPSRIKNRRGCRAYGLKNLAIIIAFLSVGRFIIDNNKEFGFLMSLPLQTLSLSECIYFIITIAISLARSFIGFYIETTNQRPVYIHINIVVMEAIIAYLNLKHIKHIYSSGWSMIFDIVCVAKLISFHLVSRESKRKACTSHTVPTLGHFSYFLSVPTLCFEFEFPLRTKRDTTKIMWRFAQLALGFLLFVFVMDQYAIPSIYRITGFSNITTVVENIINFSISTIILFLVFFYTVFYCLLEAIAEITLFYDTCFYQEWWNASSAREFWALWNRPVYVWLKKHVYSAMISKGVSRSKAAAMVFVVSGLVHEYVISISIKKFTGWFFITMLIQIPLIHITESFKRRFPSLANFFFWGTFCVIGQPSVMLLYYRSLYIKKHRM